MKEYFCFQCHNVKEMNVLKGLIKNNGDDKNGNNQYLSIYRQISYNFPWDTRSYIIKA